MISKLRGLALVSLMMTCFAASLPAVAAPPVPGVQVGTLTCTVAPVPPGAAAAKRPMSCKFTPATGMMPSLAEAGFSGVMHRTAGPPLVDAQLVLIWRVVAPRPKIDLKDLEGRYLSSLGQGDVVGENGATTALRQRGRDAIELRPRTPLGGARRTLVIELRLSALKA